MATIRYPESFTWNDVVALHNAFCQGQTGMSQWIAQYERQRQGRMASSPKWLSAIENYVASKGTRGFTPLQVGTIGLEMLQVGEKNALKLKPLTKHDKSIVLAHMVFSPQMDQRRMGTILLGLYLGVTDVETWKRENAYLMITPLGLSAKDFAAHVAKAATVGKSTRTRTKKGKVPAPVPAAAEKTE